MFAKIKEYVIQIITLRSLRARIFILTLLMGIIPSILMRYAILDNYEERAVQLRADTVQNQLRILADHLLTQNYLENYQHTDAQSLAARDVINAELEMLSDLYDGRVLIIDNSLKVVKDTHGIFEGKVSTSEEVIRCFMGESISNYDKENGYIEMTTPIGVSSIQAVQNAGNSQQATTIVNGVMLTSISSKSIIDTMEILNRKALILEAMMIIAIVVLAVLLSIGLTRPFNRIKDAIDEVKEGYSDKAIAVPDYQETVHIVNAFNEMLQKMNVLDQSRQEFVANVSHELKTPLTSMKVLADSLLGQDNVPVGLYREFMEDIVSEIDRENQIITDLLALVKMDKKAQKLNIAFLNINELTELILKRLRPLARKKDIEVVFESNRIVMAQVDEVKMTLIMSNLVDNAIKYNREHGWVKVVLDADHQFFTFTVNDSGMGIPEDSLNQIYERFYRVDKSHSREIGGTGLGLAITKNAVLMHRGSITVASKEGEGTTFQVKIPLSYISQQD